VGGLALRDRLLKESRMALCDTVFFRLLLVRQATSLPVF
jgi:hypothetical protein